VRTEPAVPGDAGMGPLVIDLTEVDSADAAAAGTPAGDQLGDAATQLLASVSGHRIPRSRYRRVRLPPTRAAATQARGVLVDALNSWQIPHLREPAELVVSELVSNAVLHAGTDLGLRLAQHDAGVCVAVSDHDPRPPLPRAAGGSTSEGGRGLYLVNLLSYRWGWLTAGREKLVWAFLTALAPVRRTLTAG